MQKMKNKIYTDPSMIGKYLNRYGWSDIDPIGKIIGIKSKTQLIVQKVEAGENLTKMNFIPGGFFAHCDNQHAQTYNLTETEEQFTFRISKSSLKNVRIQDAPVKFYDYNF